MKEIVDYLVESKESIKSIKTYKNLAKVRYDLYTSIARNAEEAIKILEEYFDDIVSIDLDWKNETFHKPVIVLKLDPADMSESDAEDTMQEIKDIFTNYYYVPRDGVDMFYKKDKSVEYTIVIDD